MNDQLPQGGVDVVFWDFGGVFTASPFGSAAAEFAAGVGLAPEALEDLVFGYHTPDGDHPWHQVERGEIPVHEAFGAITQRLRDQGHTSFDLRDFFKVMSPLPSEGGAATERPEEPPKGRPEMVSLARELQANGIANAIITNNVKEFAEGWKRMIPLELFDQVIDSSHEGVRKPDPAIYRLALGRMGDPDPGRTLFLDDFAGNLAPAAELGIQVIHVQDTPDTAIAAVRALALNAP